MNPTLKSVLIRMLKIAARAVASIVTFLLIMTLVNEIIYRTTLWGVLLFVVTLTIVLVNSRRVALPVRLLVVALYIAAVAVVIMWHKLEYTWWGPYRQAVLMTNIIAVLLSAFMPLLRGLKSERFARAGKIALLAAVLMLDFAAAFPNVSFTEYDSEGMYMGIINVEATPDYPRGKRLRTFGYAGQYWYGFNDVEAIQVLTPVDAEGRMYESRIYRHAWDSEYMVDTLTRDTIWLHGMWSKPGHKSMENIELAALRHQWQYDMWHRLKRFVHLFTDKKQHSENLRHGIKYDPVEDTLKYKAIEKQVEREIQEALKDESRGLGFCHRYWAVKQEILIRHGIEWRSPAEMNPDIMFD